MEGKMEAILSFGTTDRADEKSEDGMFSLTACMHACVCVCTRPYVCACVCVRACVHFCLRVCVPICGGLKGCAVV